MVRYCTPGRGEGVLHKEIRLVKQIKLHSTQERSSHKLATYKQPGDGHSCKVDVI